MFRNKVRSEIPPVLAPAAENDAWPITMSGRMESAGWENGRGKRSTRLLPQSAMYKFPLRSTASPVGKVRPAEKPVAGPPGTAVKAGSRCPSTKSAGAPLAKEAGLRHASTRWLLESAT